ncbi:MAG TPA: DUF3089 domain-containing protein, partial [Saprospiraceae bacterium]|nr:DUF3089 domain-containing protein [Saprospiraceae bacterium]
LLSRPLLLLLFLSCLAGTRCAVHPRHRFDQAALPPAPDYSKGAQWAALPTKQDLADRTPCPYVRDEQAAADVDVFFLYPTTYTGSRRSEHQWNADMADVAVCKKTDESSILFQASAFNGAGRVFAPYYRQAHLHVFFGKDTASAAQALQVAYSDVQAAFEYYMKHWNQGRPFILAGHSQGARHIMHLLRDRVEGTPLEQQLVAAYIVGWPVRRDFFRSLKPCESADQTDCFCTWRTWERRFAQRKANEPQVVCTNPLLWNTAEGQYAGREKNLGGVVRPFCSVRPQFTDAEVWRGFLLATKPKFPGSFLFVRKNYHIGDINLYYMNVRENAQRRAKAFVKAK